VQHQPGFTLARAALAPGHALGAWQGQCERAWRHGIDFAVGWGRAVGVTRQPAAVTFHANPTGDNAMQTPSPWTAPAFTDLRFGFEITMYIANR
jgi:coenzyme PQQ precursor peptide PqqA